MRCSVFTTYVCLWRYVLCRSYQELYFYKLLRDILANSLLFPSGQLKMCYQKNNNFSPWQKIGADLQTRVKGEFRALHQILQDEETCVLEQLKREQEEELEKVQHHLDAVELAVKGLEDNIRTLRQASATTENTVLSEVRSLLKVTKDWNCQNQKWIRKNYNFLNK